MADEDGMDAETADSKTTCLGETRMDKKKPGIICLEGLGWGDRELLDRSSVEPVLELIHRLDIIREVIHRDVATIEEFHHYVDTWLDHHYEAFSIRYLAFHGSPGVLHIGGSVLTLEGLAESIKGRAQGRVLYLGSCLTLAQDAAALKTFCRHTGIRALIGYTATVEWVDSAAFDLVVLCDLARTLQAGGSLRPIYNRLNSQHGASLQRLGFRMATRLWATDDHLARQPVSDRLTL